jgi:hypothetical protein
MASENSIVQQVTDLFDTIVTDFIDVPFSAYTYTIATKTGPPTYPSPVPPVLPSYQAVAEGLQTAIAIIPTPTVGEFPSSLTAEQVFEKSQVLLKNLIPSYSLNYPTLNEAIMKGPFSYFLQPSTNTTYWAQIDLSSYEKIMVIEGFEQYGGIAYFNKDTGLQAIYYLSTWYYNNAECLDFNRIQQIFASTMSYDMINRFNFGNVFFGSMQNFVNACSQSYSPTNPDNDILTLMTYGVNYTSSLAPYVFTVPQPPAPGNTSPGVIGSVWAYTDAIAFGLIEEASAAGPLTRTQILGWSESPFYCNMSNYIKSVSYLFTVLNVQPIPNSQFTRDRIIDMFCLNALNAFTTYMCMTTLINPAVFPARVYKTNPTLGTDYQHSTPIDQVWAALSALPGLHSNYALNSTQAKAFFTDPARLAVYNIWVRKIITCFNGYFLVNNFNISIAC